MMNAETVARVETLATRTTPKTDLRVPYEPHLDPEATHLRIAVGSALRRAGRPAMAQSFLDQTLERNLLRRISAAAEHVRLVLDLSHPEVDPADEQRQSGEGRIELAKQTAAAIAKLPGIFACHADDWNRERTEFVLFAFIDIPTRRDELKNFSLRPVAKAIRTAAEPWLDQMELPQRKYDRYYRGEKVATGYDGDRIRIELRIRSL